MGTGDILRLYRGATVTASYPVVIYGDVNGDGAVTSQDLRVTQKHILGIQTLTGYAYTAADADRNGQLTSQDLRTVQKYILHVTKSIQ